MDVHIIKIMLSRNEFVRAYIGMHFGTSPRRAEKKYRKALAKAADAEEDEMMHVQAAAEEASSTVSHIVEVTDAPCVRLPRWMNTIVAKAKEYFDSMYMNRIGPYHSVLMDVVNNRYLFGVHGTFEEPVDFLLEVLREDPRFKGCYVRGIYLDTLVEYGHQQRFHREYYNEFCDNDEYRVALFATMTNDSTGDIINHARLMVKDPSRRAVIITDPHGEIDERLLPEREQSYMVNMLEEERERHEKRLRLKIGETVEYPFVYFNEQHVDQGDMEGSCGALTFLRMIYLLYMSHTTGHQPIDYIDDPIPCKFAVFLSRLFQQARIIDAYTHSRVLDILRR